MTDNASIITPIMAMMGVGFSGDTTSPEGLRNLANSLEQMAGSSGYQSLCTFALGLREMANEVEQDANPGQVRIPITITDQENTSHGDR